MRFTIQPESSESGYAQWSAAMKMVATLPGGIPPEFRRRLWLALADKHLASRAVDWPRVERTCFSEWAHPADSELGVQIVKDLHRTGCSLFCGEDGQENQALLKRVLLAYARWNKSVGYCQGFNMLAALLLQVTDKCESDALKLMIYLIEGVLPESYFADSLRGLSVDMAVFRELLRTRLPRLSKHLDTLQIAAKDGTTSYEPPLTNVFTMQWFLTLFCNCLPQPTVLRIWDLIMLEGNEVLLRTALAIWQTLSDKILHVRSADEFYCIMGVLTRELLEFNLIDANTLIKAIVTIGSLPELANLREHYTYNINPWGTNAGSYCSGEDRQLKVYPKERLALDISALKKQYLKLKQRQRQAHIIISAAINRQPPPTAPVAMNHLLLGKSALLPAKRLGPPKGSIPPVRHPPSTLQWKDAPMQDSSSSSSDTELCDDPGCSSSDEDEKDERPKTSQLEDNLPSTSDTLMNNIENTTVLCDQTTSKDDEENRLSPVSDIFDNSASASVKPDFDLKKYDVESDDDFDFEQFLQDRVKCLKKSELPEYQHDELEKEEDRINYSRRNSERALQIIQENSMILHRILQYQTRLTPSPPLTEAALLPGSAGDDYCVGDLSRIDGDKRSNSPDLMSPDIHGATKHSPQDENSLEPITPSSHLNNFDVHATSEEAAASVWHESDSCDEKTPSSYAYVEPTSLSSPVYTQVELSPPYTPSSASLDNPPSIPTSLAIHPEVITSTSIISDHYSFPDADELISILPADSVSHGEQSPIAVNLKDESIEFPLVSSISDVPQALFPLPGLLHEIPMQTSIEEDSKLPPPPKSPSHSISLQPSVSTILHSISAQDNDKSPEYGSKYTSILEKSRNLDEKYHTLIGNVENRRPLSFHLDSFEEKSFNYERRSSSENILKTGCQESLLSDGTIGFDVDKQKEAESSRVRPFDGNRYDMSPTELLDSPQSSAPEYDRNVTNRQTTRLSPDVDTCKTYNEDVPSTKSPSKIFNPFPIQVSSRQNKDVAVKLGLYKK